MKDSMGIDIHPGDHIIITGPGAGVRKVDVGQAGTVTGFARTKVIVTWHEGQVQGDRIGPRHVTVVNRDTGTGWEGNRVINP